MPEEWKKSSVIPVYKKDNNKQWKTTEQLAYLMHVIEYSKIFIEKLKAQE
jgi:hypothetical protein